MAFLDITPNQPGHTLVVPVEHSENVLDLEVDAYISLMAAVKDVSNKLRSFYNIPRVGIVIEGLTVAHVHVHVIPIRKQGDLLNQHVLKEGELSALGEQLRSSFG